MLAYLLGVALFALGICVSVALHEAGHMVTAKAFGMKVRRYFVGFGPKVFSFRRGETEYGLKWIPLGGFCDIAGMTNLDEVAPHEASRAMWRHKVWKRTVVLAAGSVMHFILGFVVLYVTAATMGLPNLKLSNDPVIGEVSQCVPDVRPPAGEPLPPCEPSDPAPAREGGLRAGDDIVAVAGEQTETWGEAVQAIQSRSGPTPFTVLRDGQTVRLTIDIADVGLAGGGTAGMIGASKQDQGPRFIQYSAVSAIGGAGRYAGDMFVRTWEGLLAFPEKVPLLIDAIMGEERDPGTPVSVIGASHIGGELVELEAWRFFLLLLVALNLFIGVFNLLPLLPLDGGHIAVTWYERVRDWVRRLRGKAAGGPVDYTKLSAVTVAIVIVGGAVVLLTITADIVNPLSIQ